MREAHVYDLDANGDTKVTVTVEPARDCWTCRYWVVVLRPAAAPIEACEGECRLRSWPTFPRRFGDEWCGEHTFHYRTDEGWQASRTLLGHVGIWT